MKPKLRKIEDATNRRADCCAKIIGECCCSLVVLSHFISRDVDLFSPV